MSPMSDLRVWTPPEPNIERRWVKTPMRVVLRNWTKEERDTGGVTVLDGISFTHDKYILKSWFGDFEERIAPGAAKKTLAEKADVRSLFNHDPNIVLGRTTNGTLELAEVKEGLHSVTIPDMENTNSANVVRMIQRGDVDQMSFAMRVIKEQWTFYDDDDDRLDFREIQELELFDTSPVTYPANPDTSITVGERSMQNVARIAAEGSKKAQRMIDRWTQRFDIQPGKPGQENHSVEPVIDHSPEPEPSHSPEEERSGYPVSVMKLRLAIAEREGLRK